MPRSSIATLLFGAILGIATPANATPVFDHSVFPAPTVLDYSDSPAGLIPQGAPVVDQYLALGVRHDGHTTTPPGPPGMSSLSGLPGLEAGSGDLPGRSIEIAFDIPIVGVGAFYLMADPTDAIILSVFDEGNDLIETIAVFPEEMPLAPGPFGFNEGFVGILSDIPFTSARFDAETLAFALQFVIDDLHFVVPEPATSTLAFLGALAVLLRRNRLFQK